MITLNKLKWGNLFSYGDNNEVDFGKNPLTQIVGSNGHGKSSIALVLEEVLYNKNSKGIKKSDILNRNSTAKSYWIELNFDKDGDSYNIKTVRGSTQTVKLTKNDIDISSHTSTGTYKTIESVLGFDHKTFSQIVYQSHSGSLEFLTSTDSVRKKFLIDLLGLSKYSEAGDVFKDELKTLELEQKVTDTKIEGTRTFIKKYENADLTIRVEKTIPERPTHVENHLRTLRSQLQDIEAINKKVLQNNKYKELLSAIVLEPPGTKPELDVDSLKISKAEHQKTIKDSSTFIAKMKALSGSCPTCLQAINQTKVGELISESALAKATSEIESTKISKVLTDYEQSLEAWSTRSYKYRQYEEYHSLYDPNISTELLDKKKLEKEIAESEQVLKLSELEIKSLAKENSEIIAHNAKVEVILNQLEEAKDTLQELEIIKRDLDRKLKVLNLLVKTFSNTGLIAYKIECLVKDLEEACNSYLGELSSGRFQIAFEISTGDKLNVVVTDSGKSIEMSALSGGERARVNAAALLAIRKLMQSLSNSRINLLILDETIENLDLDGKEKLIEVLLKEPYLNTFIISHGFQHPLLEKLQVIKKNNISKVDYG